MRKIFILIILTLLSANFIYAQQESSENDAVKTLRLLENKYKGVITFTGEFDQIKKSEMLLEEIKSNGQFYYEKPDRFRCDYAKPNESINIFVKDSAWVYVPELKQVEKYYIGTGDSNAGESLNQMLIGFGVSTDDLLKKYTITVKNKKDNMIDISLIPKTDELKKEYKEIVVTIDQGKLLPVKFIITETNDEATEIMMKEIKDDNPKIDAKVFELNFPKDVEIIEQD